jgi:hypothetical protein
MGIPGEKFFSLKRQHAAATICCKFSSRIKKERCNALFKQLMTESDP